MYELNIGSDLPKSSSHVEFAEKDEDTELTVYACVRIYMHIIVYMI